MAISKRKKRIRMEDQVNPCMTDIRKNQYVGPWREELLYVERIAAESGIPIESLRPINELFGGISASPKPERREINQKFFAWAAREKPKYPDFEKAEPLNPAHLKILSDVLALAQNDEVNAIKKHLLQNYKTLKEHETYIQDQYRHIAQNETQIEAAELRAKAKRRDFGADITAVCESGAFCLAERGRQPASGKSVVFLTRPITVPYFNKEHGFETTLPFGQFSIEVYWEPHALKAMCHAHRDNLNHSGYIHPHVNSNGIICFGNNLSRYNELCARHDLPGVMQVVLQTLSNFIPGEGSAYISVERFAALADRARKAGTLGAVAGEDEDSDDEGEDPDDEERTPMPIVTTRQRRNRFGDLRNQAMAEADALTYAQNAQDMNRLAEQMRNPNVRGSPAYDVGRGGGETLTIEALQQFRNEMLRPDNG